MPWFVAVGLHRPHLPFIVPKRHLDLYPLASVPLPSKAARAFPAAMPSVAAECAGTFKSDRSGGCVAQHGSFELWQQYQGGFNATGHRPVASLASLGAKGPGGWSGWSGARDTSLPDAHARELKQYYSAAVSHTDELFGKVLAAAGGAGARTIVVLAGDHGEQLLQGTACPRRALWYQWLECG